MVRTTPYRVPGASPPEPRELQLACSEPCRSDDEFDELAPVVAQPVYEHTPDGELAREARLAQAATAMGIVGASMVWMYAVLGDIVPLGAICFVIVGLVVAFRDVIRNALTRSSTGDASTDERA